MNHQLITGDCLLMLPSLPRNSVDVVVTSPPYNIGLQYNTYNDELDEKAYLNWLIDVCVKIRGVMKPQGSFFLNVSGTSVNPWLPFELIAGLRRFFELQNHIVWVKSIAIGDETYGHYKPINSGRFLNHVHEHIFHLTLDGNVKLDRTAIGVPYMDKSNIARRGHAQDLRCRGNTWYIPYKTVNSKEQKFSHPGTFPVELPQACIRLHGVANPIVLDPFMGTGTTLVAAQLEGGTGIGIEIDPAYVAIATQRLGI